MKAGSERKVSKIASVCVATQVQAKLEPEWSPEQIAAHLRRAFPDRPRWHVCHETIYQALYRGTSGRVVGNSVGTGT
jgi:IS30 family transposase